MVNEAASGDSVKNGKARPGSPVTLNAPGSSNGQGGSESSDDENQGRIRVGREYQAVAPPYLPPSERRPDLCPERALLVWSPIHTISNKRLDEFVQVAKDKYSYNVEQALGMLFWHKHDLERAMQDLANFTPFPDEWSVEDKVLFEQAFQFHGKSFHRIRQMLPDKSIAALVKYYYSWKKTRTRERRRWRCVETATKVSQHTLNAQGSDVRHLPRFLAVPSGCDIEPYRIPEPSAGTRINARCSNDGHLLAVQGCGRDKFDDPGRAHGDVPEAARHRRIHDVCRGRQKNTQRRVSCTCTSIKIWIFVYIILLL